ncbi:uncharacterized protein [Amphiura filiformis]|uniref:uncharacterized protein n=1 Tax=Amphiura filiformis TaxID=82378 RepID=UPI003B224BD7
MGRRGGGSGSRSVGRSHSSGSARRHSVSRSLGHGHGHSAASASKAARIVKTNHRKGIAYEKKVATALKRSNVIKTSSVKTQVPTKNHGRADIVARTKSGKKIVVEAKNFRGNPLMKDNVKQVKGYGKALNAQPVIAASKTTTVPSTVKQFANRNNVPIMKK